MIETVFVCPEDDTVVVKAAVVMKCPQCKTVMENSGWFESNPEGDKHG